MLTLYVYGATTSIFMVKIVEPIRSAIDILKILSSCNVSKFLDEINFVSLRSRRGYGKAHEDFFVDALRKKT